MRRLALVLALLALSWAQECGPGGLAKFFSRVREFSQSDDNPYKDDLDEQEDMLNRLGSRIGVMYQKASDAYQNAKGYIDTLETLQNHVDIIEGTGCGEGEFNCQDGFNTCVDKVLVCDSKNDCKNGQDETEETCYNPFEEGSVWEGTFSFDRCTRRQPQKMKITIRNVHPSDYFNPDVVISGDVFLESDAYGEHAAANFRLDGDYYYGTKQLIFQPPEEDRLGIMIQYDGHRHHDATGYIIREATLERCAELIFHRVDN